MKQKILTSAFLLLGIFAFSSNNSGNPTVDNNKDNSKQDVQISQNSECSYLEYKFVATECYYRECTTTTTQGPDGNYYTEKSCGPWMQVPCPKSLQPQTETIAAN